MKLLKMTASFGRLDKETLTLTEGLNLIEAPNEGGKSTWCAFLRAMLYGIPTRERDKKGLVAEKNRYQPWSGGPLEGTLDLTWRGREITLRRYAKGGAPFAGFEAVYTGTAQPVAELTGENCGEVLLGVGREMYERTAFLGQGAVSVDGTPELERRIAALATSGEETVSYSETERQLKNWKNQRMANRAVGAIPKKEEELAGVEETLSRLAQCESRSGAARCAWQELEARRAVLEGHAAYHQAQRNRALSARYAEAKADLERAAGEEADLGRELARFGVLPPVEQLRAAQGELAFLNTLEVNIRQTVRESGDAETAARECRAAATDPLFPGMTPEEANLRVAEDRGIIARGTKKPMGLWTLAGVLLLFGLAGLVVALVGPAELRLFGAVAGGVFALLAALCGAAGFLRAAGQRARSREILAHYGVETPEDMAGKVAAFQARWDRALEGERQTELLSRRVAELSHQKEELLGRLLAFAAPFAPEAGDGISLSVAFSRALMLQDKLEKAAGLTASARRVWEAVSADGPPVPQSDFIPAPGETLESPQETAAALAAVAQEEARVQDVLSAARGEASSLGDLGGLQGLQSTLGEEISALRGEYDAISLALEGLEAANAALQARFSPEVNRRAGELMSALTGGKYESVSLTHEFETLATPAGELLPRRGLLLSRGTADQLYLALRLALCDLTLPREDPAPLVLDDALVTFDDGRAALALALLKRLAQTRQILLFTCQHREGRILSLQSGEE